MRSTPALLRSEAKRFNWLPFVVTVSSSSWPASRCRDSAWNSHMMFLRTSGSPPVMRSLRTPRLTNAEQM